MIERLEGTHKQLEVSRKKLQALNAINLAVSTEYHQAESQLRAMQLQLGKAQDEPSAIQDQGRCIEEELRQNQRVSCIFSFTSLISYQIYPVTEHFSLNGISYSSLVNCADGEHRCGKPLN